MLDGRISLLLFTDSMVRVGAEHLLMLARGMDPKLFRVHYVCPPELASRIQTDVPGFCAHILSGRCE